MDTQNFILHPDTHWIKMDNDRVQLRQPNGNFITFNKHADDITNALKTLSSKEILDIPVDKNIMSQVKELLNSKGLMVDIDSISDFQIQRLLDHHGTTGGKITNGVYPTTVTFLGKGKLARIVKNSFKKAVIKVADKEDTSSLLIAIADQENHKFLREANAKALKNNQPVLFFRWAQQGFKIGPFVVPGQTATLECAYQRELASSLYPDELHAYQNSDASSFPKYEGGPVLDELASALITRHVMAILGGNYDIASPSAILTVNPVTLSVKESYILRLPRCGNTDVKSEKPKRAIRDLLNL